MMKLFILLLACCCFLSASAQNIVPDPGFENWNGTIGIANSLDGLNLWTAVNGSPDHHHINNPPGSNLTSLDTTCVTGMGQNQCGFPCEGLAVLGSYKGNGLDGTKEWAAIALGESMETGKTYDVSMWVQNKKDNPDFIMETSQWGIFFSETAEPEFDPSTHDFDTTTDHFVTCEQMITGSEWTELNWEFMAAANYTHIFVGYVGNVEDATTNAWSESGSVGFYAWIDKVSVVEQEQSSIETHLLDGGFSCYPNPTSDELHVEWPEKLQKSKTILLINPSGETVKIFTHILGPNNTLDIRTLASGNYYLKVEGKEGAWKIQKR